jgi:hypothetical protein
MSNFKSIGSDMEVFAKKSSGEYMALCGLIGGSKETPRQLPHLPLGFMVQEDNVALEFNIPPVTSASSFIEYMERMKNESSTIITKLGFEMSNESSALFDKGQLVHPKALTFGCEPDYDAWLMCENPKPTTDDPTLRTAGGHIHIGTDRNMAEVIKNMDLFLGVPSILLDDSKSSKERRKLYGKAGAMRPKFYGVEYRTLSNFWLFNNDLIRWVYYQTELACHFAKDISKDQERIVDCINNGDKKLAENLVKEYNININYAKHITKPSIRSTKSLNEILDEMITTQYSPYTIQQSLSQPTQPIIFQDELGEF